MTSFDTYWVEFERPDKFSPEMDKDFAVQVIAESFSDALDFVSVQYQDKTVNKIGKNLSGLRLAEGSRARIRNQ